ncbi:dimethylaniline monooxygenase [Geodermatophilus sp. TF02-6]|uniref:NAD(P)-binding domain-containing protein n=1 Tax=Geodermatophilus sp. TF02-6 TaxID=2250575 RepID=UPI000DEA8A6D|nr:NAD(P)-binding domain-containing protein [Geodermatophilus sp. TF02-6]RBY80612.1 dimethylaniline monooxygenase [Geodermatophilus sp. TF02-6]
MPDLSLVVIGAGPYGLAVAAHARHTGIETLVLGEPMSFWRRHMPRGMLLRSGVDWHLDAAEVHTMERYLAERGIRPADVHPIPVELFVDYATWFQDVEGIQVRPELVTAVRPRPDGVEVELGDAGSLSARSVVAAPGISSFAAAPWHLVAGLSADRYAHTCFLTEFDRTRDARTLIVGGRQSAYEWAALLADQGVEAVHVVHRHDTPAFTPSDWSFVDALIERTESVPGWYRSLPDDERAAVDRRFWAEGRLKLEPWLPPRLPESVVHRHPRTEVVRCVELPSGEIRAELSTGETLVVDHVVLATGYRADVTAVPYLADVPGLATANGFPVLDEHMQTSVPGLFVTGFAATHDFGPFFGFVRGCTAAARLIVPAVAARTATAPTADAVRG